MRFGTQNVRGSIGQGHLQLWPGNKRSVN